MVSCTATKITSSWTAPSAGAIDYKKIMVVGVVQNEDNAMRKKIEEHMVDELKGLGYAAVAYTNEFNDGELRYMRYDSVKRRLANKQIDGVIVASLLAIDKERIYVQDKTLPKADNVPLGGFWETTTTGRQNIGRANYYVTSVQYFWQCQFFDVKNLALLYNATSTAFEVSSEESFAHKYGKAIVNDMQKRYLLTEKK